MAELIDLITSNFDYENFFSAKLTAPLTATDTDIFLDAIPTASEGVLVIDWDVAASREVIFYNSKTASKVTCPSVAERGFDDSTATTHLSGANVIMAPVRAWFRLAQQLATTSEQGWKPLGYTPNTVTDNGNRSYTLVFNSVDLTSFLSNQMRLKITRTTAAPTQCASLNGTNQYFSKTTPSGITFTDDFAAGAWVKPASYVTSMIISRWNGTSGWYLHLDGNGAVNIAGTNAGAGNYSTITAHEMVPLNRWTHVAGQLDMSAFTNTTTTSYIMINGMNVPGIVARAGTNPTALVQAGNLEVGGYNGGSFPFNGKLAQVWVSSTKVTQDGVRVIKNQGLTSALCSTYSIISAYSLSNSVTDINTSTANDLTAQNSAATTNADTPFCQDDSGVSVGTVDVALVMSCTFSTNTTLVIQLPEGCTVPTSGSITSIAYSGLQVPFGWVTTKERWVIETIKRAQDVQTAAAANTWYNLTKTSGVSGGTYLTVPIGSFTLGYLANTAVTGAATTCIIKVTLSTASNTEVDRRFTTQALLISGNEIDSIHQREKGITLSAATPYYLNALSTQAGTNSIYFQSGQSDTVIYAIPAGI